MELHYNHYQSASEQNVIIIHGLFGSSDNWHVFAKKLSDIANVYTLDMRNHGRSAHNKDFSLDAMADDVEAFISQHRLKNITLIGHSMGGKISMLLALQKSALVKKLMVLDIAPGPYAPGHDTVFKALRNVEINTISSRKMAEEQMREVLKDEGTLQFLLKNLRRKESGGYEWKIALDIIEEQYEGILMSMEDKGLFERETMFVAGGKSAYIEHEHLDLIHSLFSNSSVEFIHDAGHWLHVDAPDELLELCINFINRS